MDLKELKKYVVAKDGHEYDNLKGTDIVCLNVMHSNLKQIWPDIRFSLFMRIITVKEKLMRHGGTSPIHQKLFLIPKIKDFSNIESSLTSAIPLNDDEKQLMDFQPQSSYYIYILDTNPFSFSKNGGLEDTSLVKKYVMSDEDYEKRDDSARVFKKKMQQLDPNWTFLPKSINKTNTEKCCNQDNHASSCSISKQSSCDKSEEKIEEKINVGDRCEIVLGGGRGKVMYVGDGSGFLKILPSPIQWVGICLDEPLGTCDGSIKGKKLFSCPKNHGIFITSDKIKIGDYPEHDPFQNDDKINDNNDDEI